MIYIFKDNNGEDITYGMIEIKDEDTSTYHSIKNLVADYKEENEDDYTYEGLIEYLQEKGLKVEGVESQEIEF